MVSAVVSASNVLYFCCKYSQGVLGHIFQFMFLFLFSIDYMNLWIQHISGVSSSLSLWLLLCCKCDLQCYIDGVRMQWMLQSPNATVFCGAIGRDNFGIRMQSLATEEGVHVSLSSIFWRYLYFFTSPMPIWIKWVHGYVIFQGWGGLSCPASWELNCHTIDKQNSLQIFQKYVAIILHAVAAAVSIKWHCF